MIVPMEKITLLVSEKDRERALSALRKQGGVHIQHLKKPVSVDINTLETQAHQVQEALAIIEAGKERETICGVREDVHECVKEIIFLQRDKEKNSLESKELDEKRRWYERWGNISHSSLKELQAAGIYVRFYICPKSAVKKAKKDKIIQVLKEEKGNVYVMLVSRSSQERLEGQEQQVPQISLAEVEDAIEDANRKIFHINERLYELGGYNACLTEHLKGLHKKIEFHKVKHGMIQEEGFCYLEGFCPKDALATIKKASSQEGWGFISRKPERPEDVPTLLRNPKWIRIISPIFKFMGALPGYNEFDVSVWFLGFLSLFFAMLIGDAGYGFIFLGLTIFARRKLKKAPLEPFFLIYLLSAATIIWGMITGTWFGSEQIARIPFFNSMVITQIDSFVDTNQTFMMYLCFLIGVIHLSIAHGIIAFRFINSTFALSQLGWISILWGLFFVAGKLILEKPLPGFTPALLLIGTGLVLLFSNPHKNILKRIGASLVEFPLKAISSFSDIVSYLRLFAVGYATVVVATNFNDMALGRGIDGIFAGVVAAFVLFFGHILNILLGLMAVIVHGIRLNMLEFSGHLNMQWSGTEYKPFQE